MDNHYQEKFGYPAERTKGKVRPYYGRVDSRFYPSLPVLRHGDEQRRGNCDASPKGGRPGFLKILNDKQLFLPDVAGNKLFHGYGNLATNSKDRADLSYPRSR